MGRLLGVSPCPVCNYYVEGPLHFGGSNRSNLFIHNRYLLAVCHDCHNIISTLIATPGYDLPHVLETAQAELQELERRSAKGDVLARQLLPLHRAALDHAPHEHMDEHTIEACSVCGSQNTALLFYAGGDEGERFDESAAWVDCPRCEEGKLLIQTVGSWDEIDDDA